MMPSAVNADDHVQFQVMITATSKVYGLTAEPDAEF